MEAISDPSVDESAKIVAAVAIVTSVATATVIARLYVRIVMIRSCGWDVSYLLPQDEMTTNASTRTP
jgi:hypothetical protein